MSQQTGSPALMSNTEILQFMLLQGIHIENDKGISKMDSAFLLNTWWILASQIRNKHIEAGAPKQPNALLGSSSFSRTLVGQSSRPVPWNEEEKKDGHSFRKKFGFVQNFFRLLGVIDFGLGDLQRPEPRRTRFLYTFLISVHKYAKELEDLKQPTQEKLNLGREEMKWASSELASLQKEHQELLILKEKIASDTQTQEIREKELNDEMAPLEKSVEKLRNEDRSLKANLNEALRHETTCKDKHSRLQEEVYELRGRVVEDIEGKLQQYEAFKSRCRDEKREAAIVEDEIGIFKKTQKNLEGVRDELEKMGITMKDDQEMGLRKKAKEEERDNELSRAEELKTEEKILEQDIKLESNSLSLRRELLQTTRSEREKKEEGLSQRSEAKEEEKRRLNESVNQKQAKISKINVEIEASEIKLREGERCKEKLLGKAKELSLEIMKLVTSPDEELEFYN